MKKFILLVLCLVSIFVQSAEITVSSGDSYLLSDVEINAGLSSEYCTYGLDDAPTGAFSSFWTPGACLSDVVLTTSDSSVFVNRMTMLRTGGGETFGDFLVINVDESAPPPPPALCEDPLANNTGQTLPCTYDPGPDPEPPVLPFVGDTTLHVFGHSLINYERINGIPDTQDVKVPWYLNDLFTLSGYNYSACAQYGFVPAPPAICQSGWDGVQPAWDDDSGSFSGQCVNTILVTVRNFRMDETDINQEIAGLVDAQNYAEVNKPADCVIRYFFYEPWGDAFTHPKSASEALAYYNEQASSNALVYQNIVSQANAQLDIDYVYIPVAQMLGSIARGDVTGVSQLGWLTMFEDSSPHGTATTYFLTSLMTYYYIAGQLPPASYLPPSSVDPVVVENYGNIAYFIATF